MCEYRTCIVGGWEENRETPGYMAGTHELARGDSGTYEDGNFEADITGTTEARVGIGGKLGTLVGYAGNVETREDTTGTAEARKEAHVGMGGKSVRRVECAGNEETREDTTGTAEACKEAHAGMSGEAGTRVEYVGNVETREDTTGTGGA